MIEESLEWVAQILVSVFRVPGNRVIAMGLGEEQLQDTANPEAAINRRVSFYNLGPV